ncbi:hypothetical protein BJ508DRAFT_118721 [Ascobolus immersus RN42]|uniref:MYND-type domain-containing protein n=1 Tax=Ascobolus immersus RN42 TaxID=1160509 RepID=A0A3N4I6H2_ASCIM|nr:hypothetical protein BJ508DRAFT_118721 [Ascobolus immersus RN42]
MSADLAFPRILRTLTSGRISPPQLQTTLRLRSSLPNRSAIQLLERSELKRNIDTVPRMPLPAFEHKGHEVWVRFHPEDDLSGLDPVFLTDPEKHIPQVEPSTGRIEAWGIGVPSMVLAPGADDLDDDDDDDDDNSRLPAHLQRMMANSRMYNRIRSPECQWVKHRANMKESQLKLIDQSAHQKRDYILKIEFEDLRDKKGMKFIWRVVKVSGETPLSLFADKVILPAMGWARNYHGYLFIDRSDGALFGPKTGDFIDIRCNIAHRGYEFIDDRKYTIAHLFQDEKAEVGFVYDIGDYWCHKITVEEIRSTETSDGKTELLSGSGACPAEDSKMRLHEMYERLLKNPRDCQTQREIRRSQNYRNLPATASGKPWLFDPHQFDLAEAQNRLQEAMRSRSNKTLSGLISTVTDLEDGSSGSDSYSDDCTCGGHGRERLVASHSAVSQGSLAETNTTSMGKEADHSDLTDILSTMIQNIRMRPKPGPTICGFCDTPKCLVKCGRCRTVWYCGRDCQVSHWKEHKLSCASP